MARGIHGRSGPAPDPNALRRGRDGGDWVTLPAAGRQGDVPAFPLRDPLERELLLWEREWRRPQAVMWEHNGLVEQVAMYVRAFVAAENHDATAAMRVLVVRLEESLGLSIPGLARNKWVIAEAETEPVALSSGRASARQRFTVVS